MLKALPKPRWAHWESLCVEAAFQQKIQLKVIAAALQKSVNSVSKKIRALGLRPPQPKPGRIKGREYTRPKTREGAREFEAMSAILKTYSPADLPLTRSIRTTTVAFSFASPLQYTLLEEKQVDLPRIKRGYDESILIPSYYLDQWAFLKGFKDVSSPLKARGLAYWRAGQYFSKTQVLVYLNGIRLAKNLPALSLDEKEQSESLEKSQDCPT